MEFNTCVWNSIAKHSLVLSQIPTHGLQLLRCYEFFCSCGAVLASSAVALTLWVRSRHFAHFQAGDLMMKKSFFRGKVALGHEGKVSPKPYQNHHLNSISLLMFGSGLLKPGPGSAKKPESIRIRTRNTEQNTVQNIQVYVSR